MNIINWRVLQPSLQNLPHNTEKNMKKIYNAPVATLVSLDTESIVALSIVDGGADSSEGLSNKFDVSEDIWGDVEE